MMPLTILFLPPLLDRGETEMDAENKREGWEGKKKQKQPLSACGKMKRGERAQRMPEEEEEDKVPALLFSPSLSLSCFLCGSFILVSQRVVDSPKH